MLRYPRPCHRRFPTQARRHSRFLLVASPAFAQFRFLPSSRSQRLSDQSLRLLFARFSQLPFHPRPLFSPFSPPASPGLSPRRCGPWARWRARALIGLHEVIADLFHAKCVDEAALKISEASLRAVIFPGNEIVGSVRAAQRIISIRIRIEDAVQKSKLPPA